MSFTVEDIFKNALNLPQEDRANLAVWLIDSLDQTVDDDAKDEWQAEMRRRIAELDSGAVKTVSWSEARRKIVGAPDGTTDR